MASYTVTMINDQTINYDIIYTRQINNYNRYMWFIELMQIISNKYIMFEHIDYGQCI